jgi:hypothetical protein
VSFILLKLLIVPLEPLSDSLHAMLLVCQAKEVALPPEFVSLQLEWRLVWWISQWEPFER